MDNAENVYCRLCADLKPPNKLLNLETNEEQCQEIVNKLSRFNVQGSLNDSILPKMACFTCVNSLQRSFDFVAAVEQAQSTLNDFILMRQIKKEEHISDDDMNYGPEITYEAPTDFENDIDSIKVESDKKPLSSKSLKRKHTEINKSRKMVNSIDALPLSQLKLTWKDYNWMCSYCETQFPTIDELQTHAMQYHKTCNPYRCTDCKTRKLRLDSFIMHVKRHRKYLKFSCYKCSIKFTSIIQATKHSRDTHKSSKYICHGCNANFESESELTIHTRAFYRIMKSGEQSILPNDSLTCRICERSYKTKGSFSTHLLKHSGKKKDHTCEVCGKCFFYNAALVSHMVQHTDTRPFQCEICKSSFKTSHRLRLHIGVHDGGKPFACDQCGKCFRLKSHLTNHSIIHTDSLPHICTYCNKSFRFKTILNQHVRQHTGVKPYSCTVCHRDFTNWPNYNKHMKRRHNMNMSKKKHTPDGTYPIDPATGEVVLPEQEKISEWKKKMMQAKVGRPKLNRENGKVNVISTESNNN